MGLFWKSSHILCVDIGNFFRYNLCTLKKARPIKESEKKEVKMLKKQRKTRILVFMVTMVMLFCASVPFVSAAQPTSDAAQTRSAGVKIYLDGREILAGQSHLINSVTYVPLRAFAEEAGADSISWDAKTKTALVKKNGVDIYVRDGGYYVSALGRYFYSPEKILNINDRLYVPIRAIAAPFCINVGWDGASRSVILTDTKSKLKSASEFYNSDDLYWLSRIISAESAGEVLSGQIAVGNVVINRKESRSYPNTIYGVIFDRKGGTQFSPVSMGTIYRKPSEASVIAAKICLEGYSISDDILFFMNPRISTSNWISKNRPFAFTIGNHDFYY